MSNKIRVLIVDDEPLARRRIAQILADENDFEIVGEASNGKSAITKLEELSPDLIFLDIKMPVLDGFGLIKKLSDENLPEIIFVTAFDQHAIRAFEVGAIDYVLKPINLERFRQTLARVRKRIFSGEEKNLENKIADLFKSLKPAEKEFLERIAVKKDEKIKFVEVEKINYIKSLENYIEIFTDREKFLLRETMDGIESKLDSKKFIRIRRSTIVKISAIKELNVLFNNEFLIILQNGTELISSRRFRKKLDSLLKL
jgi:two-component system, LytTR family, response regulator